MSETEIAQVNRSFEQAMSNGDTDTVASHYTADGICLPPDAGTVKGREGISAMWAAAIADMGLKSVKLDTLDLEITGDSACEIGEATLTLGDGAQPVVKYIVVWKKEDGTWRLHRDIWNAKA